MSPQKPDLLRQAVDDLASALQVALCRAAIVRRHIQSTAAETALLEASLGRAVSSLRSLQSDPEPDARQPSTRRR